MTTTTIPESTRADTRERRGLELSKAEKVNLAYAFERRAEDVTLPA